MKINELMSMDLQWISRNAAVADAARIMRDNSLGFLLVSDPGTTRLVGVVTDRDLALRILAEGKSSALPVAQAMTPTVITCRETDSLSDVEELMRRSEKSRLVVVDERQRPIGVLSLTDILLRDRPGRAVWTARGVLARESGAPRPPVDSITLTPSTREDEDEVAAHQATVARGGDWSGTMKEFP